MIDSVSGPIPMKTSASDIRPSKTLSLFDGVVRVFLFGRPTDFSKPFTRPEVMQTVTRLVRGLRIKKVFIPTTTDCNARVVDATPANFKGLRYQGNGVTVYSGASVDGVKMFQPAAVAFDTADCPVLILRSPDGSVVATHAGRNSLLDAYARGVQGVPRRDPESVVFAALASLNGPASEVRSALVCGIGQPRFDHPAWHQQYGQRNLRMADYLFRHCGLVVEGPKDVIQINLAGIAQAQLGSRGVLTDRRRFFRDGIDTYGDKDSNGQFLWHSHRRDSESGEGDSRNLVLVVRCL